MSRQRYRNIAVAILLMACMAGVFVAYTHRTRALGFHTREGEVFATTIVDDRVVARANGEPIMLSQISYTYLMEKMLYDIQKAHFEVTPALSGQFAASAPKPDPERTLNMLVAGRVLAQEVRRKGSKPDQQVLDKLLPGQQTLWHQLLHPETRIDGLSSMSLDEFTKISGFAQDIFEASGLSEEDFFGKYVQSSIEDGAKLATFRAELKQQGSTLTIDELKANLQNQATIIIVDRAAILSLSQGNP